MFVILNGPKCDTTSLQHANCDNAWIGIDGNSGEIADMKERKVGVHAFL